MQRSQVFGLLHTASAAFTLPTVHTVRKVQHSRSWSLLIVLLPPHALTHEKKAHKALFWLLLLWERSYLCTL